MSMFGDREDAIDDLGKIQEGIAALKRQHPEDFININSDWDVNPVGFKE